MALRLVNLMAIVLSPGLLFPWARTRSLHYNVAHLAMLIDGDLGHFAAVRQETVSALGSELGEGFDVAHVGVGV